MKMTLLAPFACRWYPFLIHGSLSECPYIGVTLSFLARWLSWDSWCSKWERPYLGVALFFFSSLVHNTPFEDLRCGGHTSLCHLTIGGSFCVVCCHRGAVFKDVVDVHVNMLCFAGLFSLQRNPQPLDLLVWQGVRNIIIWFSDPAWITSFSLCLSPIKRLGDGC